MPRILSKYTSDARNKSRPIMSSELEDERTYLRDTRSVSPSPSPPPLNRTPRDTMSIRLSEKITPLIASSPHGLHPPPPTPATPLQFDVFPQSREERCPPNTRDTDPAAITTTNIPATAHVWMRWRVVRLWSALNPRLTLENSGSVARDHLASERTFLAYVRTSLAIASTGVALVQLFTISSSPRPDEVIIFTGVQKHARPLGAACICLGITVLIIGTTRYFTIQTALTRGQFPVAQLSVGAIALMLTAVVIVVFGVLVQVKRVS